jgi:hypothetical protein
MGGKKKRRRRDSSSGPALRNHTHDTSESAVIHGEASTAPGAREQSSEREATGRALSIAALFAWSLGILGAVLLAASLLLLTLNLSHPGVHVYDLWVQETVVAATFPALGLFIAFHRPEHPVGWLFCVAGLVGGVDHFCGEYATYALLAQPGSLPAGEAAAWVCSWLWVPFNALLVFVALLFPDGRLPSRRWRPVAWLNGVLAVVGAAAAAFLPGPVDTLGPIENPLGIKGLESARDLIDGVLEALSYAAIGLAVVVSLLLRFRRAGAVERQQIKWLAYAACVVLLGAILSYGVSDATDKWWIEQLGVALLAVGFVGTPIAVGMAILKYRLYEIDIIINRTLVYGALTVVLAILFQVIDASLQHLLVALTNQDSLLGSIITALLITALFKPVKHRIQHLVDRYLSFKESEAPGRSEEANPS